MSLTGSPPGTGADVLSQARSGLPWRLSARLPVRTSCKITVPGRSLGGMVPGPVLSVSPGLHPPGTRLGAGRPGPRLRSGRSSQGGQRRPLGSAIPDGRQGHDEDSREGRRGSGPSSNPRQMAQATSDENRTLGGRAGKATWKQGAGLAPEPTQWTGHTSGLFSPTRVCRVLTGHQGVHRRWASVLGAPDRASEQGGAVWVPGASPAWTTAGGRQSGFESYHF